MENLRLPLGLGRFFVNLTADFHHNSEYLIIVSTIPKRGNNFKNHKYLQRDILRINVTILMVAITKVKMQLQVIPKVSSRRIHMEKFLNWKPTSVPLASLLRKPTEISIFLFPQKPHSNLCSCLPHRCFASLYLWYFMSYGLSSLCFCYKTRGRFSQ